MQHAGCLVFLLLPCLDSTVGQTDPPSLSQEHYSCNLGWCPPAERGMFSVCYSSCVCPAGYSDTSCSTAADLCDSAPCTSPEVCVSSPGSYSCVCPANTTGSNCDIPLSSPCASSPCENEATCVVDSQTLNCSCPSGYSGDRCQYANPCTSGICLHGSCEAMYGGATYKCTCDDGWIGRNCNISTLSYDPAVSLGCFEYESVVEDSSKYVEHDNGNSMQLTKCSNQMKNDGPPNQYYTACGMACYVSEENYLNTTSSRSGCSRGCPGDCSQKCGNGPTGLGVGGACGVGLASQDCWVYQQAISVSEPTCDGSQCGGEAHGFCVNLPDDTFQCVCEPNYNAPDCTTSSTPCDSSPCNGGACTNSGDLYTFTCSDCPAGMTGSECQSYDACWSQPCVPQQGTCQLIGTYFDTSYVCVCEPGYEGVDCGTEIDNCKLTAEPCMYGGTCHNYLNYYNCTCVDGTEGQFCQINPDDCTPYKVNGVTYKNRCVVRDTHATCVDGFNSFTCECSADWTDTYCTMLTIIWNVLVDISGSDNFDDQIVQMLEDLVYNPTLIQTMIPFILGLQSAANRSDMSWQYDDLFLWAAYEGKTFDIPSTFVRWNDVALGNCFTFNHENNSVKYNGRAAGNKAGLEVLIYLNQPQYLPWITTASMLVFVSNIDELIYSQSVRYNAAPNQRTEFQVSNGCLNSCYQDAMFQDCGCMDPRYQSPSDVELCGLSLRTCVENAAKQRGDPSTWSNCVCPLPCSNGQFDMTWSTASFVVTSPYCGGVESAGGLLGTGALSNSDCFKNVSQNYVYLSVSLPNMNTQTFRQTPAMDLNKFVSYCGGLLGVLMGISVISFVEVAYLFIRLIFVLLSGR